MTTKIIIKNDESSNGDIHIQGKSTCVGDWNVILLPGEQADTWISTSAGIFITETWPTVKEKPEVN